MSQRRFTMIRRKIRRVSNGQASFGRSLGQTTVPFDAEREEVRRAPRYHVPRIVITRGRGVGRDEMVGTKCVIGRAPDSDILLQDQGVSRRHAYVALQGEVYVIHDLGSCNGTLVNGRRVRAATLVDGDVIQLGRVELLFRCREMVGGA